MLDIYSFSVHSTWKIQTDILDSFSEYGPVKNFHVNLDRRSGFCKGYALVEYNSYTEAQDAINALHGNELLGKTIHVDWAFVKQGSDRDTEGGGGRKKTRTR